MTSRPIEILLVDDNEDDIVLAEEAFSESNMLNIRHVVRDGEQALAFLRKEGEYQNVSTPGLVLLDINMPRKNGFEVLEAVRADRKLRHIPIAIMTVSDRDEDIARTYAEGACSYIRKPVSFEALREVARQFELYWTLVSQVPGR